MKRKEVRMSLEDQTENQWLRLEETYPIPLNLDWIEPIQEVLQKINVILNVTLEILEFVKAFVTSLLDPILKLLDRIIELLKALLELGKLGIYTTGDWGLIQEGNYEALKGGYLGFQNRMIKRWLKEDPKRPDFKASGAVAIYLYGSTDFIEGIDPIVKTIELILSLFRAPIKTPEAPPVTNLKAQVVPLTETQELFGITEPSVQLTFNLAARNSPLGIAPNVGGFVVEMNTFENGLMVGYSEPKKPLASTENGVIKVQGLYKGRNAEPYRWYSGTLDRFVGDGDPSEKQGDGDNRREQFLLRSPLDTARINPNDVQGSGNYLFFEVFGLALSGGDHTINIPFSKLPKGYDISPSGEITENPNKRVSFRVFAVSGDQKDKIKQSVGSGAFDFRGADNPIYNFPYKNLDLESDDMVASIGTSGEIVVPAYSPFVVSDNINDSDTIEALKRAIKLSLYYAVLYDFGRTTLSETGKYEPMFIELEKMMFGDKKYTEFKQERAEKGNPIETREILRDKVDSLTLLLFNRTPKALTSLLGSFDALTDRDHFNEIEINFKNDEREDGLYINYFEANYEIDIEETIVDVQDFLDADVFVAHPPLMKGQTIETPPYQNTAIAKDRRTIIDPMVRLPLGAERSYYLLEDFTSASISGLRPFSHTQAFDFLTLILGTDTTTLGDSEWISYRPFVQGFKEFDEFLLKAIKWLEGAKESVKGFGEKIIKAIELIEMKIQQIQGLLALIDRILEMLKNLEIELELPLGALVHIGTGNQELIQNLITSTNKPTDSAGSYTAGAVLVAGGVPTFLLEIISALIVGGGDEIIAQAEGE